MNRREFLRASAAGGGALIGTALLGPAAAGCGGAPPRPAGPPPPPPVDAFLAKGARVMWIAAHPDDECFPGALLARASIHHGNPLYMLILTHGDGGECCLKEGCKPDLATVRGQEMRAVAERYRATLQHERFWNAPLPVESFPKRHQIFDIWRKQRDPVQVVARAVRKFRPDLVLTFSPVVGATGHPEHQLTSRVATAGIRQAARASCVGPLPPHHVARTYYVLNKFWVYRLLGRADPGHVTERFDATLPCTRSVSCLSFMTEATKLHRTQDNDMSTVRSLRSAFARVNLRWIDPYQVINQPTEPA
ncbi:MAG: PIG-L family deacetylase [Deltaproteobacteria bacterium]|nr:PIG-L family deacetylase [Deltaproteobacteria bacterium]